MPSARASSSREISSPFVGAPLSSAGTFTAATTRREEGWPDPGVHSQFGTRCDAPAVGLSQPLHAACHRHRSPWGSTGGALGPGQSNRSGLPSNEDSPLCVPVAEGVCTFS